MLTPSHQDDSDLHREIRMNRPNPTPHGDLELQDELNYVRNLRTHHVGLLLLIVKKFDALDRLEELGHGVALIRARSHVEHYDSPTWKQYIAAMETVKALDLEEEKLRQALLALRGSKLPEEVTSTPACADSGAQGTSNSPSATAKAKGSHSAMQISIKSTNNSHSTQGAQAAPEAARPSTVPRPCCDLNFNDGYQPSDPQLTHTQLRGYWFVMGQMAATNSAVKHEPCTVPAVAVEANSSVQEATTRLCSACRVFCQALLIVCQLCSNEIGWCGVVVVLDQLLALDWPLLVQALTRFCVVVFGVIKFAGRKYSPC